jgi:hypothetical protein
MSLAAPQAAWHVEGLALLPNNDLVVGSYANELYRYDGQTWTSLPGHVDRFVHDIDVIKNGDIAVVGEFSFAGGGVSAYFARMRTNCPAAAVSYGTGCSGSVGPLSLTSVALPWIGGTWRASLTGVAPSGIPIRTLGFTQTSLPLVALHPAAGLNCLVLASPVSIGLLPIGQDSEFGLEIPLDPALVGVRFRSQGLQFETDPSLTIVSASSSNGLLLTIGAL